MIDRLNGRLIDQIIGQLIDWLIVWSLDCLIDWYLIDWLIKVKKSRLAEIEDLIRLEGPLTEDAVLRTLQARFLNNNYQVHANKYHFNIFRGFFNK